MFLLCQIALQLVRQGELKETANKDESVISSDEFSQQEAEGDVSETGMISKDQSLELKVCHNFLKKLKNYGCLKAIKMRLSIQWNLLIVCLLAAGPCKCREQ